MTEVVPLICEPGDDDQHGSSVVCDVNALQALSRRVHLGKFVAESKFQVRNMSRCVCPCGERVRRLRDREVKQSGVLRRTFKNSRAGVSETSVKKDLEQDCRPMFVLELAIRARFSLSLYYCIQDPISLRGKW